MVNDFPKVTCRIRGNPGWESPDSKGILGTEGPAVSAATHPPFLQEHTNAPQGRLPGLGSAERPAIPETVTLERSAPPPGVCSSLGPARPLAGAAPSSLTLR